MIFYFSATGNSEWVAKRIAEALGDKAVDMMKVNPESFTFCKEDYLGVVFPVYWYAAPEAVLGFSKKLNPNNAFTFAVCTFSNVTGNALEHFSENAFKLKSGYGVSMPDNYPISEVIYDTEETTLTKLKAAPARVDEIIARLKTKDRDIFDADKGENPEELTASMPSVFKDDHCYTKPFYVEKDLCISCGMCETLCPADAILITDGYPAWVKEKCYQCMACINRCPVEAIQYGEYSKGRYRYYLEKYLPKVNFN
ncbi:MAG: 4Fe-4S binding protein [Ruminococcaceae bacterium]|nr:4Fe-4S binding protein [Oscillospiraceae bacterium]